MDRRYKHPPQTRDGMVERIRNAYLQALKEGDEETADELAELVDDLLNPKGTIDD